MKRECGRTLGEERRRWCSGCAKRHTGAKDFKNERRKMCEDCQLKNPSFGLPAEGKRRWCSGCAKGHAGAVNLNHTAAC